MTTAFSSAMVSYDQDVSVANRKKNPEFYGYVKDTNLERTSTFLVTMLLAAFHNLSRTIGTALLLAVSGSTTFVVMGAEMAFYIGFKVLRNDFVLWIPGLEGALKYIAALIVHVVVKVLVDFTGMIHCRGPKLMGGSLFTFSTVLGQILPFVALSLYSASTTVENKSNPHEMKIALLILACCWGLSAMAFFGLTDRDKWWTFYGTTTGAKDTIKIFRSTDDPKIKMLSIFTNHSSFTESIKDEVIAYMHDNWAIWEVIRPAWFTPKFIASVGDEFIPGRALQRLNEAAAGGVREKLQPTTISSMKEVVITLTTVDTMTDIFMIYLYKENGLHSNANTMIAMISINTFIQLFVVLAQNRKKGWKTLLKEWLITLLFIRPFVDAWRVHNKHEDSETTFDLLSEMILNKGIELATESIPGCVLQCYVLLLNPSLGSSR